MLTIIIDEMKPNWKIPGLKTHFSDWHSMDQHKLFANSFLALSSREKRRRCFFPNPVALLWNHGQVLVKFDFPVLNSLQVHLLHKGTLKEKFTKMRNLMCWMVRLEKHLVHAYASGSRWYQCLQVAGSEKFQISFSFFEFSNLVLKTIRNSLLQ